MDYLWSPWRYQYVSRAAGDRGCIFCEKPAEDDDERNLIVYRGNHNFILLNLFPYTSGHVLIAPYEHVAQLEDAGEETVVEMMLLARRTSACLRRVYQPQGLNLGMNIGECAGAGIAGHIHMHVLPRWTGDASFMTTVGETRVVPEDLADTYRKLKEAFEHP
jgi:ATP adenylyltransferase